jgi:hypothetical protein
MQRKMELGMQAEQVALAAEHAAFERTQAVAQAELDRERAQISAEQIVTLLCQIEVSMAQGNPTTVACLDTGRVEMTRPAS